MKELPEYEIVQNSTLGAIAVWSFVAEYYKKTNSTKGPNLPMLMPILPLVFHNRTVESLFNRQYDGGFYRALTEDRTIFVNLQNRMQSMSNQTFSSLNMAFSTGLLVYDHDKGEFFPKRKTPPYQLSYKDTKKIISAAKRLGHWFATINFDQICVLLDLRY